MEPVYDVVVRTAKEGYLAYEYRKTWSQLETSRSHKEISSDPRYVVTMKFVGAA